MQRRRLALLVSALLIGCGGNVDDGGHDAAAPAEDAGGYTAPDPTRACPACTSTHACLGPEPCLQADGCTYGWCDATGFRTSNNVCLWPGAGHTWCNTKTEDHPCATRDTDGFVPTTCVLVSDVPRSGLQMTDCRIDDPDAAVSGQPCGQMRCGTGCRCLCENFCWCSQ
jgi:hypothetical protein